MAMDIGDVRRIAVIGAGTMGAGSAQTCAAAGFEVSMRDVEARFVEGGLRRIREPLEARVSKGKMAREDVDAVFRRIRGTLGLAEGRDGARVSARASRPAGPTRAPGGPASPGTCAPDSGRSPSRSRSPRASS